MSKVGEIQVGIIGNAAKLVSECGIGMQAITALSSSITAASVIASSLGSAFGSIGSNISWAIGLAKDNQQASESFSVLLGSADKAAAMLQELKAYSSVSPFSYKQIIEAQKGLIAYGIAGADALPLLKQLGNIAGGSEEKLRSLSLAFSQVNSAGRLQGQDLLQLINAGWNPLENIAAKTGETMLQLKKRMEAGGISVVEVTDALKEATSGAGRFAGMTERMAATFGGQWSSALDTIENAATSVGKVIIDGFDLTGLLSGFNTTFGGAADSILGLMPYATKLKENLTSVFIDAVDAIQPFVAMFPSVLSMLGMAADAVALTGKGFYSMWSIAEVGAAGILTILAQIVKAWTFLTSDLTKKMDFSFADGLIAERDKLLKAAGKNIKDVQETFLPTGQIQKMADALSQVSAVAKKPVQQDHKKAQISDGSAEATKAAETLIQKLNEEYQTIQNGAHANDLYKLSLMGVNDQTILYIKSLDAENNAMKAMKKAQEDMITEAAKLIEDSVSPAEKAAEKFDKVMQMYGRGIITFQQMQKIMEAPIKEQMSKDAKTLIESVMTKSQKASKAYLEAKKLFNAGAITGDQFAKAAGNADKEAKGKEFKGNGFTEANSQEARDKILAAMNPDSKGENYQKAILEISKQQLAEMRKNKIMNRQAPPDDKV